jgi:holo-[acyl-carrier protein] synthase
VRITVGTDIVSVSRVRRLLSDNTSAAGELFTAHELSYCEGKRDRFVHLAARFAAKEALLKALGTGLGPGMRWTDVEVRNDPRGKPRLVLHGSAAAQVDGAAGLTDLSLSHTGDHAVAVVVLHCAGDVPAAPRVALAPEEGEQPCACA